ncbi:hypothetical protein VRB68_09270 [Pseudomonas trivialis]|uniref:hypothetical protein n=1 Tax=Pseudomonas trivialis TaxID=200450 RepID=UPI0030CDF732
MNKTPRHKDSEESFTFRRTKQTNCSTTALSRLNIPATILLDATNALKNKHSVTHQIPATRLLLITPSATFCTSLFVMTYDSSCTLPQDWRWIGKLTPPLTLLTSMPRQALLASLKSRIQGPLVLVIAPPGYGKTTLLMQWRQELLRLSCATPVAWLSLDEADTEPNRFLAYLILALDHAGIDLGHLRTLAECQSLDTQPHRTITALLHALARENRQVTLLLDDYHSAANAQLDHLVQTLLEQSRPLAAMGSGQSYTSQMAAGALENHGLGA